MGYPPRPNADGAIGQTVTVLTWICYLISLQLSMLQKTTDVYNQEFSIVLVLSERKITHTVVTNTIPFELPSTMAMGGHAAALSGRALM